MTISAEMFEDLISYFIEYQRLTYNPVDTVHAQEPRLELPFPAGHDKAHRFETLCLRPARKPPPPSFTAGAQLDEHSMIGIARKLITSPVDRLDNRDTPTEAQEGISQRVRYRRIILNNKSLEMVHACEFS